MADITTQISAAFQDGLCAKTVFFSCKNVTAGDTINVGAFFRVISRTGLICLIGPTVAQPAFTGTVVTIPAGPAQDAAWLIVYGVAV